MNTLITQGLNVFFITKYYIQKTKTWKNNITKKHKLTTQENPFYNVTKYQILLKIDKLPK